MKYRKYPINIEYWEEYIPPRCRKPRYRRTKKIFNAKVREVTKEEAPVAFVLSDYCHWKEGRVKIRLYKGKFYILDTWHKYRESEDGNALDREFVGWAPTTADKFHLSIWQNAGSYEEQCKRYKDRAREYIIIDNLVWTECGEPMYEINTFGLGHNHGGTGMFVATCYNPNIPKTRYFNALEADKAIAEANAVAARRGDTESVGKFEKMINVLIPECVRRKPLKEHGDGNEFQNLLNDITEAASSPMEAGLLAITAALK